MVRNHALSSCATLLAAAAIGASALPSYSLDEIASGNVFSFPVGYSNIAKDDFYPIVNVTFDGQTLPVLLDTGSGDLFVASDRCNVVDVQSGCYLAQTYKITKSTKLLNETFGTVVGLGTVSGTDSFQKVSVGGKTILNQLAVPLVNFSGSAGEFQDGQFSGIWGLNTRNVSRNWYFNQRLPFMDTLLAQGKLAKPLFSLTFPRRYDPDSIKGSLTIGGIENIPAASKVTYSDMIDTLNYNYDPPVLAPQGWTVQIQAIRVNGKTIPVSKGDLDPAGRYLSLIDSGSSRLLFRRPEFEKIAAAFTGKTVINPDQDIYFDCSIPQLIELKYHDTWFPIDPLDMIVSDDHGIVNGTELCHAPISTWDRTFGDSIIGPTFLKNAVSVFDYVGNDALAQQPRLGLAPLTDAAAAVKRYSSLYQQRLV
ncbi:hypothetical protein M409DRAFT_30042 [Zasmidium cellare ATCC 36951]|uniref:Peptidase A1 domain-containing protein n=1 Tax=Zasmidium cellare ATCC 36951 TaxID=1080233 RepID=A0A6A6BX65_ZASCE|nr:uncharacterized protein M409DRAFT_30042 [Zasmidium cellare ATCC 36951]KAF2159424.1 hypothetical protein M409DRAFT_30042 [Zasmidium cellare ATCC 36951]